MKIKKQTIVFLDGDRHHTILSKMLENENDKENLKKEAVKLYFQAGELAIREKNKEAIYSSLTALERLSDSEYGYALYEALLDRAAAFQKQELNAGA